MSYRKSTTIIVAAAVLGIAGCAANDPYPATSPSSGGASYPTYPSSEVARYGYVESVETATPERRNTGPGIGAIGGAIAGGVAGTQVGGGSGRAAATIGGAVLGGVIGHQVEQRVRSNDPVAVEYRFRVRMDDGSYQSFNKETHDNIRVGDRVRIERNNIFLL